MAPETKPFDPADCLDDRESVAAYLTEAFVTGDPAFVGDALGVVARASGMSRILGKPACPAKACIAP
jgi:probable addiction module antidote protein